MDYRLEAINMVLASAEAEVGYIEKNSAKDLDNKEVPGNKNYTKYARDLDAILNFYNGKKQGAAWCDVWVDWNFVVTFGADLAKKMLCQPDNSLGAGCTYSAQYYKDAGRFFTTPQVGDQVFFVKNGRFVHTGLVYKVTALAIYTIEGNTNKSGALVTDGGKVCKKQYSLREDVIGGFGRPRYELYNGEQGDGKIMVELRELKKGDKGTDVKTAQVLLINKFKISCGLSGADGDFGKNTENAVKKFQVKHSIVESGKIDKITWEKLLA